MYFKKFFRSILHVSESVNDKTGLPIGRQTYHVTCTSIFITLIWYLRPDLPIRRTTYKVADEH